MKIADSTVLITGANRGIGLAFAQAFLARGARKVYAAAREPSRVTLPGVTPVRLDVTSQADVEAAAQQAGEATIVVNNAGIATFGSFMANDAVSKAALWSLSNGLRNDLRAQHTQVLTLHMGFVDTDLTRGVEMLKSTPEAIVEHALDALEAGAQEVLADELTRQVKRGLAAAPADPSAAG
jgi:NAD(P)-dependent dehydrogenase (short-subunit alcohol dehydrogenase family)